MFLENVDGERIVEVLELRAGDSIEIRFDHIDKAFLKNKFPEDNGRQYLVDMGYSESIADLISKNLEDLDVLQAIYHVEKVIVTIDEKGYEAEIKFHNLVNLQGYTEDSDKTPRGTVV
jgi:hypothetical protein